MVIRTRQQLLDFVAGHTVFGGVKRAIEAGTAEVCGAFRLGTRVGVIVYCKSPLGGEWSEFVDMGGPEYKLTALAGGIPWDCWIGDSCTSPLYRGDYPIEYVRRCKEHEDAKG